MSRVRVDAWGEQTSLHHRKRRAGACLLAVVDTASPTGDLRHVLRQLSPAGFLLTGPALEEPLQVLDILRELASLRRERSSPPLLATTRSALAALPGATPWPAPPTLGRLGDPSPARQVAEGMGVEARAMGFKMLLGIEANPGSFHEDPDENSTLVERFIKGLMDGGVMACPGMFPGAPAPPDDGRLSAMELELQDLRAMDLPPLRAAVQAGAAGMLWGHGIWPAIDERLPPWCSRFALSELARGELGFRGINLVDDLAIPAIRNLDPAALMLQAVSSGAHMALVSDQSLQLDVFEGLVRGQEDDLALERVMETSSDETAALLHAHRPRGPRPTLADVGSSDHTNFARMLSTMARA